MPFGDSSEDPILSSVIWCDCNGIISIKRSLSQSASVVQVVNKTVPKSINNVPFYLPLFILYFFYEDRGSASHLATCSHEMDLSFNDICKLIELSRKLVRFLPLLLPPGESSQSAECKESNLRVILLFLWSAFSWMQSGGKSALLLLKHKTQEEEGR